MPQSANSSAGPVCHRCMQPVSDRAVRCPHCGTPQGPRRRATTVLIGSAALLALLFAVCVMFAAFRNEEARNAAPENQTQSEQPAPVNR